MPDFIGVTITFGAVLSVKDKDKLKPAELQEMVKRLVFDETEWLGEPQSPNGCVVTMKPKAFNIGTTSASPSPPPPGITPEDLEAAEAEATKAEQEGEAAEADEPLEFMYTVKGIKKGPDGKMLKKPKQIRDNLKEHGTVLVLGTRTGGIKILDIEDLQGKVVGYVDEKDNLVTVTIGDLK